MAEKSNKGKNKKVSQNSATNAEVADITTGDCSLEMVAELNILVIWGGKDTQGVLVPENTTYAGLVDILYGALPVDRDRYDLVLQAKYFIQSMPDFPPSLIRQDDEVKFFLKENATSDARRTPLCVSFVEKSFPSTEESKILASNLVIDFDSENNDIFLNQVGEDEGDSCLHLGVDAHFNSTKTSNTLTQSERHFGASELANFQNPFKENDNIPALVVGSLFDNKKALQMTLHKYAMTNHFEFRVEKSRKELLYVKCFEKDCNWRLRALRAKSSQMFEIKKYVQDHTCSLLTRREKKRHTPTWVIGDILKKKNIDYHHDHMPKKIIEDFQQNYGIKMTYNKAWKSRKMALMPVRGTVEDSYCKLPSYLYMLEKNNEGTITDIQTDDQGNFKYMFLSMGFSIRGFRSACRPVLCVDASFLKHKFGGQMLIAIALDANEQLYPVAFGVVDSENNNSWTYFMEKLRVAIGSVPDLVFVSDRHPSIANALSTVFPEAHHGACTYHIKMNIMAKFKTDHCHAEFDNASRAYTLVDFNRYFDLIRIKNPRIAAYLEEIGRERWSRAYFPGTRYNQMTSNYAESFNSQSMNARKYPITILADYVRFTLQEWFHDRREKAAEHTQRLTPNYEKFLCEQVEKSRSYSVQPLNQFEFYVHDGECGFSVDLRCLTCTCRVFDVSGLPCLHALAVTRHRNVDAYELCSRYYTTQSWLNLYTETCYPVGDEDEWEIPDYIKQRVCLKPLVNVKKSRPQTKRRCSQGEITQVRRRCSSCGGLGHNRASCSAVMPAPSTARASSQTSTQPSTQHSVESLG